MRQALLFGLPLALPLALYLAWFVHASRTAQAHGHPAPKLGDVPWPWLVVIGIGLLAGAGAAFTMMGGAEVGGHYEPPRLIDGQVVPGRITR